jgi:integrase
VWPPRPIAKADLEIIKAYLLPRRPHMGIVALRDRALFFYLLTTGARVSEALQVRRDDLDAPVVRQKGGSEKVLLMPPGAHELIDDYLRARIDREPWLWITHKTNAPITRLGAPGVREVWRKLAKKLGITPWTTHQLRHTCATELLEAGVPELVIAEHLGHHGLASLHIYGQVRDKQRQAAVAVMDQLVQAPRARLLPKISRHERY